MATTLQRGLRFHAPLPDMCEPGQLNELACFLTQDGVAVYPTAGTIEILDRSRTTQVSATLTILPENSLTYVWPTPSTTPYGEGWLVRWTVTVATVGHTFENEVQICRNRLTCPVSAQTLWQVAPALNPSSGDSITTMTAASQERMIEEAWWRAQRRLIENGRRAFLVIGAGSLQEYVTYLALSLIFDALAHRLNDSYRGFADSYRAQAEDCWKRIRLAYDETQVGVVTGQRSARPSGTWLGRGRG